MYVKCIDLSLDEYKEYRSDDASKITLSKNNVFIGKNNSGKSRLMRQVLISEYGNSYCVNSNIDDFIALRELIEQLCKYNDFVRKQYTETYLSSEELSNKIYRTASDEKRLALFICGIIHPYNNDIFEKLQNMKVIEQPYTFRVNIQFKSPSCPENIRKQITDLYNEIINQMEIVIPDSLYFPSMLSLRKLNNFDDTQPSGYHENLSSMFYLDYFGSLKGFGKNIKTGQEVYFDMKEKLLGLSDDRKRFLEYEEYIGKHFFNEKEISIFTRGDDNNIYIKEGNETEYPIYQLGDGLQTLIIITYYLYMNNDKPLKVFIDEPEIHLHPGLQRLLIKELQGYKNCQYFISTHSSSMIDICDEYDENTSIICVEKVDGKKMAYNSAYDDMDLYKLIGVRPSSIILSNCTIWVEGPTDIYYIDAYLNLYSSIKGKKRFSVGYNYNYAFNGSINIASKFDFTNDDKTASMKINKLSHNNYIIFDSDNLNKEHANYEKINAIKNVLSKSNRCHVVKKLKTIENIIPPNILKEYYDQNYHPKEVELKSIVIDYFEKVNNIYPQDDYFKIDYVDELSAYVSQRAKYNKDIKKKRNLSEYRKYFQSVWNANKYDLALFFANKLKNMSDDEKKDLYGNTLNDFTVMIKEIYRFIADNNK